MSCIGTRASLHVSSCHIAGLEESMRTWHALLLLCACSGCIHRRQMCSCHSTHGRTVAICLSTVRARQAYNQYLQPTRTERERESRAAGDRLATIIDMSFELMEPFGELRPENTAPFVRPWHRCPSGLLGALDQLAGTSCVHGLL